MSIDTCNDKILKKIDYLESIINLSGCTEFTTQLESLKSHYQTNTFTSIETNNIDRFSMIVNSSNILDNLDTLLQRVLHEYNKHSQTKPQSVAKWYLLLDIDKKIKLYEEKFKNTTVYLPSKQINIIECDLCSHEMIVFSESSEIKCSNPNCGKIHKLIGMIFNHSQTGNIKYKKHDTQMHCKNWLNQIQAQEDHIVPEHVLDKIDQKAVAEFTNNGHLRSMQSMTCGQVREWLKLYNFKNEYNHAPLVRKLITSRHGKPVEPPKITEIEQQYIMNEYSISMSWFDQVIKQPSVLEKTGKNRIKNNLYYPYVLWKIIELVIKDNQKKIELLQCIHLQSPSTINRNDQVWREICIKRGIDFYPTNKNLIK